MKPTAISVASLSGQNYLVPAKAIVDYWPSLDERIAYLRLSGAAGLSEPIPVFAQVADLDRAYAEIMQCPVQRAVGTVLGRHHCDLFNPETGE